MATTIIISLVAIIAVIYVLAGFTIVQQSSTKVIERLGKYNRMYYENTEVRYINTLRYSGVCFTVAEAYARDNRPDEAVALMNRYLGARGATLLEESLSDTLGAVVHVTANKKGRGRVVIEFSNLDQLQGIVERIQKG